MGEGDEVAAVEATLVGFADRDAINSWLDQVLRHLLGVGLARVDFVAGRIDAAYGVTTDGGLRLLIKVHRPPVDVSGRTLVGDAQRAMAQAGFPCADPLVGPGEVDGRMVSIETLLTEGERGDAHDPAIRESIAAGLVLQPHLV